MHTLSNCNDGFGYQIMNYLIPTRTEKFNGQMRKHSVVWEDATGVSLCRRLWTDAVLKLREQINWKYHL